MRKPGIIFPIFFLIFTVCLAAGTCAELTADSSISRVTVYPDSALITRTAALKLNPGHYTVVFPDIIPEVDENSLRVSAPGNEGVKILSVQLKKEFLKDDPSLKIQQLKQEIRKLEDEVKSSSNLKNIFLDEKNFLDSIRLFSNRQIPQDLVTKMPSVKDLDDTLKFLDTRLKDNSSAVMECELRNRDLRERIEVLKKELAQISGPAQKMKHSIEVEAQLAKPAAFELEVSYLVRGASWQPIYDARADFERSVVELASFGIVRQTTGEDWNAVEVSLSTAKPAVGGRMAEVRSWLLKPYLPRHLSLERKMDYSEAQALRGAPFEKTKNAVMALGGMDALQESEPLYAYAQEKGIAVVYTIPRKADIKSDGSEQKLPISSQSLKADFEYSAYPKASLNAYLLSKVANAKDLQLLAGRVNVFLDGDFVGSSSIDSISPAETFDLYLGVDENVKVKREEIEKKVDETIIGNIPSPTRRTAYRYKLSVENYKSKKIRLKLFEAMPVPQDDRIKVKMGQVSLEPKEKDWKDKKGVWLWELELNHGEKKEITYGYTVEHPREMQVEGL